MVRKPDYCKGIIIADGKSELLLAEHIKSNLHLPIEIYAESNGKTSIQIEKGILKNFSLMPIMDLDDTSEDRKQKYISGEMFKNHWLSPYIVPIWNKNNLDDVLLDLNIINKLPNNKEKGKGYRDLFPTKY